MKKIIILLTMMVILFTGCGKKDLKIFKEEEVKVKSEEIIELTNKGDFKTIYNDHFDDIMKAMSLEEYEKTLEPVLETFGEFVKFDKYEMQEVETEKATDVIVQYGVVYENHKAVYTFQFNKEFKLTGYYIK